MRIHTKIAFRRARKDLRNNATPQEVALWDCLKGSRLGHKFQRQHSIGNFIADFYCPSKKLVIEIDGNQHNTEEARVYDKECTNYFESMGITVIRFWNNETDMNIESVLQRIQQCLK